MKKTLLKLAFLLGVNSALFASSANTFSSQLSNDTLYVNQAASGNNNGQNWSDAYLNLQDAISNANDGDQIWVAKGKYLPTSTNDTTISFSLVDNVKIYGGFAGTENDISTRDFVLNETILSGDIGVVGDSLDNVTNVVVINSISSNATLDGFTVQHGFGYNGKFSSRDYNSGAGIYIKSSDVILKNLIVKNNAAVYSGGVMITSGSSPTIENIITENNYGRWGGGLSINSNTSSDTVKITNITSRNNEALSGTGIYCKDAKNYIFTDVKVYNNKGNGIEFYRPNSGSFSNINVHNNSKNGIQLSTTYASLTDKIVFKNMLLHSNSSKQIQMQASSNSTKAYIYNATIVGNTTISGSELDKNTIVNSILSGTVTNATPNTTNISYSVAPSGVAKDGGNNQFDVNPKFADSTNSDFRILDNSPARDNALNSVMLPELDVLGNPRIENGKLDIGAIEYDLTVGILENTARTETVAFPNPFENNFTVDVVQNSSISIYNNEGVLVQNLANASGKTSIDASTFTSGLYHIMIVNVEGKQYATIMKK